MAETEEPFTKSGSPDWDALEQALDRLPDWERGIVGLRASLRCLPFAFAESTLDDSHALRLSLSAFRASFISWMSYRYPLRDLSATGTAAYAAARSAVFSVADNSAVSVARSAIYLGAYSDVYEAAHFAALSTDEYAAFELVWIDVTFARTVSKGRELLGGPLFVRETLLDVDLRQHREVLARRELFSPISNWSLWLAWWDHLLPDTSRNLFGNDRTAKLAMQPPEFWGDGDPDYDPHEVMARVADIVGWPDVSQPHPPKERDGKKEQNRIAELSAVVSPFPSATKEEQLNAGPNPKYDQPEVTDDIVNLPAQQLALARTLDAGLSSESMRNKPSVPLAHAAIGEYRDELLTRGTQPIIGLLEDQAALVETVSAQIESGELTCDDGIKVALRRFLSNHKKIRKHFPLNSEREALYARQSVDTSKLSDPEVNRHLEEAFEISKRLKEEGIATEDYLAIVAKVRETERLAASLPDEDDDGKTVGPKKRALLRMVGWWHRLEKVVSASDKLSKSPTVQILIERGREILEKIPIES